MQKIHVELSSVEMGVQMKWSVHKHFRSAPRASTLARGLSRFDICKSEKQEGRNALPIRFPSRYTA